MPQLPKAVLRTQRQLRNQVMTTYRQSGKSMFTVIETPTTLLTQFRQGVEMISDIFQRGPSDQNTTNVTQGGSDNDAVVSQDGGNTSFHYHYSI